jgi:DNA-binding MltR family transcriptional regulator
LVVQGIYIYKDLRTIKVRGGRNQVDFKAIEYIGGAIMEEKKSKNEMLTGSEAEKNRSHMKATLDVFMEEFIKETDRASVILAAAMIEQELETVLKTTFVPIPTGEDNLFNGPNAPLASFSAKIDVAFRIGVISQKLCRDLHLIRRIRNDFAHNVTGCRFESSSVRSRVLALIRSSGMVDRGFAKWANTPREEFQMTASWMLWHLSTLSKTCSSMTSPTLEFGYTTVMNEETS